MKKKAGENSWYRLVLTVVTALFIMGKQSLPAQVLMPSKDTKGNTLSLNGIWKFKYVPALDIGTDSLFYHTDFNVNSWAGITTPGHWELQGFTEPQYGRDLKAGTGLYRTEFTAPASWRSTPVFIAFDGVLYGYEFWINGRYAGAFPSSFNRQAFDVSRFIRFGKPNTLAVKVTTRVKGWEFDTNDDWSLSGIFRDVTLFSLPPVHLKDLVVKTYVGNNNASVAVHSWIAKTAEDHFSKKLTVSAQLSAPSGKLVKAFALKENLMDPLADTVGFSGTVTIGQPLLWSAETPYLYTLRILLKEGDKVLQQYTQRVGIREVSWDNAVLKLNHIPIKLRGVDHHDLSPVNGRALTEKEMQEDLRKIREANINFIRTSHYPPHPRLLELCDSLGLYVLVEVPFGYGDDHLKDKTYWPVLETRAKATVERDKNHPSVIVWSIGNENPVTEITLKTAKYVKIMDDTRPVCFPQRPSDFEGFARDYKDSLDIYAPHYPTIGRLRAYADQFDHPMILTEYAHALGLDFDLLDSLYEIITEHPKLAGGAVWMFQDQGILRKAKQPVVKGDFTRFAWADAMTLYDTHGEDGTDGILYANRVPQADYWQVRKVYSPVKALDTTLQYAAGKKGLTIKLINRYDFTNLSTVRCAWQCYGDTALLGSGIIPLSGKPHDTISVTIHADLPEKAIANYYYVRLSFTDKHNYRFYEKTYRIIPEKESTGLESCMASKPEKPVVNDSAVTAADYLLELAKSTGQIQLKTKDGRSLITAGPWLRVGRKTTMAEQYFTSPASRRNMMLQPHLLTKPESGLEAADAAKWMVSYRYVTDSSMAEANGKIAYTFSDSGSIGVAYSLQPKGKGIAIETGLSFLLPATITEFRWIGKGPYEAYPGKDKLAEFGLFHLNIEDLYFSGNRQQVDCAVFTDKQGVGFALLADKANIAVEKTKEGLVISHNSSVSGRFNKFGWPDLLHSFEEIKEIAGRFTLVPLTGSWPPALQNLFGKPDKAAIPFAPFYYSYDE